MDSEYISTWPLFGKRQLVLQVEFEAEEIDPASRNLSLIELVTEHLIPTALRSGEDRVSIWEANKQISAGSETGVVALKLSAGSFENYDFEIGDDWIWKQTSGPILDLSVMEVRQHHFHADLGAFLSDISETSVEERKVFEVWASFEDASPSQSVEKANEIFRYFSGCTRDGVPIEASSFLGERNAIAFRIYMVPGVPSSPLQSQPRLNLTYGHQDLVAHCYSMDVNVPNDWDEVFARLNE